MQFADIKNDIAFRKIFGNEQKTAPLISFLNASLELAGDHQVMSVSIANPYQFPRIAGEKATILDVRATDQTGRKFVVESTLNIEQGYQRAFVERHSIFFHRVAKVYQRNAPVGNTN